MPQSIDHGRLHYAFVKQLKWLGLFLVIFGFAVASYAQPGFALKAAANASTVFTPDHIDHYLAGYNGGLVCDFPVSHKFFISSGIFYSAKGNYASAVFDRLCYFNLPLLAGYRMGNHLEILLGPEFGYLVSAKVKSSDNSSLDFIDECRRTELAFNGGLRYKINRKWAVDFSFVRGLTGFEKPEQTIYLLNPTNGMVQGTSSYHVSERENPKNQSLELGVLFFL